MDRTVQKANPQPHPSREQLLHAVQFMKRQYQSLAVELAEKTHRLQQLQSQSPQPIQSFQVEHQNFELRSQLNQQKIAHLEELKTMTERHHREIDEMQRHCEDKIRSQAEQGAVEGVDTGMLMMLKQKVQQSEQIINRLNTDFNQAMQHRLNEIVALSQELDRLKNQHQAEKQHLESTIYHLTQIVEQQKQQPSEGADADVKKRHEQHIALLENEIAQLANTLLEYKKREEQLRSDINLQVKVQLTEVTETERLNHLLGDFLRVCSKSAQQLVNNPSKSPEHIQQLANKLQMSTEINDQLSKHLKLCERHMEQLRRNKPAGNQPLQQQITQQQQIIAKQKQQIHDLEMKLEVLTLSKQQEIEKEVRAVVEKYENRIQTSNPTSQIKPVVESNTTSKINEKNHQIHDLQRRIQDQQSKIREYEDQKDQLIDRIKELEGEILAVTEKLKDVSQRQNESQRSETFDEIQKLKQQNNQYREKFAFLQKQAKRIILEHEQTIERLEIALAEVNQWNQQLKVEQQTFKREYQTLLRDKETLESSVRQGTQQPEEKAQVPSQLPIKTPSQNASVIEQNSKLKSEMDNLRQNFENSQKSRINLQSQIKQNNQLIELNNQRLELLKMDKKSNQKIAQQSEAKAKQLDKKCSALQTKSKKMQDQITDLTEQLVHKKHENDRLLERYEQIRKHHQEQINTLHRDFEQMNQRLVREKKQYQFKNQTMLAEQTQQYQRIERELNKFKEENLRHKEELVRVNKQKLDIFNDLTKTRAQFTQLQSQFDAKIQTIRNLENRMSSISIKNSKVEQFRQSSPADDQTSVIIADKESVYEYIRELEQKCRLLEGLNEYKIQSRVDINQIVGMTPVTLAMKETLDRSNFVLENQKLKTENRELEHELHKMRLDIQNLNIQFEKYKRNSIKDLYSGKMLNVANDETTKGLYAKIEQLSALLISKQQQINSYRHAATVLPVRTQAYTTARSPAHLIAPMTTSVTTKQVKTIPIPTSSISQAPIQSPLNFNALVESQLPAALQAQQLPIRDTKRVVTMQVRPEFQYPSSDYLNKSNATASFRHC